MGVLTRLLLGNGTLKPELRAALESEGVVLIEEGLVGHRGEGRGGALSARLPRG